MSRRRYPPSCRAADERGVALVIALMAMSLLMALGLALTLTAMCERKLAAGYRDGTQALYAAEAAAEQVIQDVGTSPDWNAILSGAVSSTSTDGPPSGQRTLPDGTTIELTQVTNVLRCGKNACSDADVTADSLDRPWGANNPFWQPYAYGLLATMLPSVPIDLHIYIIVWIGDDPSENDCAPLVDGAAPACGNDSGRPNPGCGVLVAIARAYGPSGVRRTIEVTLARTGEAGARILSWREVR